ncbi:MAG: hypothetical protein ACK5NF_01035 [Bacilli bacterium]
MYQYVISEIKKKQAITILLLFPLSVLLFLIADFYFLPVLYLLSIFCTISTIVLYLKFRKYLFYILKQNRQLVAEVKITNNFNFLKFEKNTLPMKTIIMPINTVSKFTVQSNLGKSYLISYTPQNQVELVEVKIDDNNAYLKLITDNDMEKR